MYGLLVWSAAHPHRAHPELGQSRTRCLDSGSENQYGRIFRAVARTDKIWGEGISQNVVWYLVKGCCEKAGLEHIAPHDLRRTCAKLCHTNGGEIEQIQFLLGHASVQTTERYLGCKQNLGHPVNDLFQLRNIAVAAQASFWGETDVLTSNTGHTKLDKNISR